MEYTHRSPFTPPEPPLLRVDSVVSCIKPAFSRPTSPHTLSTFVSLPRGESCVGDARTSPATSDIPSEVRTDTTLTALLHDDHGTSGICSSSSSHKSSALNTDVQPPPPSHALHPSSSQTSAIISSTTSITVIEVPEDVHIDSRSDPRTDPPDAVADCTTKLPETIAIFSSVTDSAVIEAPNDAHDGSYSNSLSPIPAAARPSKHAALTQPQSVLYRPKPSGYADDALPESQQPTPRPVDAHLVHLILSLHDGTPPYRPPTNPSQPSTTFSPAHLDHLSDPYLDYHLPHRGSRHMPQLGGYNGGHPTGLDWTAIAEPLQRVWGVQTSSAVVLGVLQGCGRVRGGVWWD